MTIVIVKISISKVKIAVLKNLLIFGEKYLPQSVRLLEGGGVETLFGRMPFEHGFSLHGASLSRLIWVSISSASYSTFLAKEEVLELLLGWLALLVEVAIFVRRTELIAATFTLALAGFSAPI